MPLRDHFHPPLSEDRSWTSLFGMWTSALVFTLNRQLPRGTFAEPWTTRLEVWVETLALRRPLPTLPLRLTDGLVVRIDLEAAYEQTLRDLRFDPA